MLLNSIEKSTNCSGALSKLVVTDYFGLGFAISPSVGVPLIPHET